MWFVHKCFNLVQCPREHCAEGPSKQIHPPNSGSTCRQTQVGNACCTVVVYVCYGLSVLLFRLQKYVRGGGVAAVDVFLVDRLQTKDPRYM